MEQLIGAAVAFGLGVAWYFWREDLERRRERYVDRGIDVVAGDIQRVLAEFGDNWSRAVRVVKTFRDTPQYLSLETLASFHRIDQSNLHLDAPRTISRLVGSQCVWYLYQQAFAFCGTRTEMIQYEIVPVLNSNTQESDALRQEISDAALDALTEMEQRYQQIYVALNYLLDIKGCLDDVQKFTRNEIQAFPLRSSVRGAVRKLEEQVKFITEDPESSNLVPEDRLSEKQTVEQREKT
jgi:hypothetical protein